MKIFVLLLSIVTLSTALFAAWSGDVSMWTGAGSDNLWTTPENWDTEPNGLAYILIPPSGEPLITTDLNDRYYRVRFGEDQTGAPILGEGPIGLVMTDGVLRTDVTGGRLDFFGQDAYFNISGGFVDSREILMGKYGQWQFDMTGGELLGNYRFSFGDYPGHLGGVANISGGRVQFDSYIAIGKATGGLCTLNLSGNTYIQTGSWVVGLDSDAILNMDSGEIYATSKSRVGEKNGVGTWNMNGGTVTINGYIAIGYSSLSNGLNAINMSGGIINCEQLIIGRSTNGVVNLSGGVINVNYDDDGVTGDVLQFATEAGGDGLLNLCGGRLNWMHDDHTIEVQGYIDSGEVVAYDGSGRVLYYMDGYDTVIEADDTSHTPVPSILADAVDPRIDSVQWQLPFPGQTVYCDVYFGTSSDVTTNAKIVDYQSVTSASVTLAPQTTYYWRVDTYNPLTSEKTEGVVWSFTSNALGSQMPITPEDGAVDVLKSQVFSWDMFGSFETVNIYVGADSPENMILVATQPASDKDYHYDGLEYGKDYYWRVDSVDGSFVQEGVVWAFTTITPACQIDVTYGDLNDDCKVNLGDLTVIASNWLACGWDVSEACE